MSGRSGRFAPVLVRGDVAPLVVTSMLGRLPLGMGPLGLVLLVRAQGSSYATVGAIVAAFSAGLASATPIFGRLVDGLGARRVLLPLAAGFPVLLGATIASVRDGAPTVACVILAALAGAALPPLGSNMRALWPRLVDTADLRNSAYAFEAIVQEVAFIAGPLLVAAIAAAASPTAGLAVCAALGALGGGAFAVLSGRVVPVASRRASWRGRGALRPPGVRTLLLACVGLGVMFGAFEVAMPAFAERHGTRAAAGLLVAMFALGSMLGGVWAARHPPRSGPLRRYVLSLAALAAAMVPLLAAQSIPAMAVLAVVAGLPNAPGFAVAYTMIDELAAPHTATETFGWIGTTIVLGTALGTAAGGWLIHAGGYRAALGFGLASIVLACALTIQRRGTLVNTRPGPAPRALA